MLQEFIAYLIVTAAISWAAYRLITRKKRKAKHIACPPDRGKSDIPQSPCEACGFRESCTLDEPTEKS